MSKNSLVYLLDTNVCIVYLKRKNSKLNSYFERLDLNKIAVCSIVKSELFYGSMRSNSSQKSLNMQVLFLSQFISLPFDDRCAEMCAKVRADLSKLGTPIGSNDLQIASIALVHDLILVTHNVREFSRVDGLKLEDWEAT
jgi:tRNA(fMet)-specific endonuclease VapC